MEGYCSTGQSPQWAVVPMEVEEGEEEDEEEEGGGRGEEGGGGGEGEVLKSTHIIILKIL